MDGTMSNPPVERTPSRHGRRQLDRAAQGPAAPRLAELAVAFGYFDQAHLAREFRSLAGCSPSGWLAEEFRSVQAAPQLPGLRSAPTGGTSQARR